MIGEGEYNINDLKEIMVTESYLGLDQDTRKCQNYEPFYNCTTRQYISTILDQCGCLPHNMVNATKISKVYTSKIFTYPQIKPNQEPLCNNSGIECARKLEVTTYIQLFQTMFWFYHQWFFQVRHDQKFRECFSSFWVLWCLQENYFFSDFW